MKVALRSCSGMEPNTASGRSGRCHSPVDISVQSSNERLRFSQCIGSFQEKPKSSRLWNTQRTRLVFATRGLAATEVSTIRVVPGSGQNTQISKHFRLLTLRIDPTFFCFLPTLLCDFGPSS